MEIEKKEARVDSQILLALVTFAKEIFSIWASLCAWVCGYESTMDDQISSMLNLNRYFIKFINDVKSLKNKAN